METTISQLNEKPKPSTVSFNVDAKEKPQPTFWFEREDKTVFCTNTGEAWNILKWGIKVKTAEGITKKKFKYRGCSNGQTYFSALAEANKTMKELGLEAAQAILRKAHEDELATADPKIMPPDQDVFGDNQARADMNKGGMAL